jgi:hypothetical protein
MNDETVEKCIVENITLAPEVEKEVGRVTVRVDGLLIRGIKIWASKTGKAKVYFPRTYERGSWVDAVEVPPETRSRIEAEVLAAYDQAKRVAITLKQEREVALSRARKGALTNGPGRETP